MANPETGSMAWPGGTILTQKVENTAGDTLASISASTQPDDPMTYNKEGQTQSYATFRKWDRCHSCGIEFPHEKMTKYQGAWYGIPCGDHKDIYQLKGRKNASKKAR